MKNTQTLVDRLNALAQHVIAMHDDAYLTGHPEWNAIVQEARGAIAAQTQTTELVTEIDRLQNIQKRNRSTSPEWQTANEQIEPLFAEMARRQEANGGELDWKKWTRTGAVEATRHVPGIF